MESPSTSLVLDPPTFSEGPGFLGSEGSVSDPQDPHVLNHQNLAHCSRHGSGPNIILTGEGTWVVVGRAWKEEVTASLGNRSKGLEECGMGFLPNSSTHRRLLPGFL